MNMDPDDLRDVEKADEVLERAKLTQDAPKDYGLLDPKTAALWQPQPSVAIKPPGICQSCDNPAAPLHTCPFKHEIDDDKTPCNCCQACRDNCCDEI